jgi:hypothetical protein
MGQPLKITVQGNVGSIGDVDLDLSIEIPGLDSIMQSLHSLHGKVDEVMTTQETLEAAIAGDTQALNDVKTRVENAENLLTTKIATLEGELATAKSQGINAAPIEASLAHLREVAAAIDPEKAPPPPPPGAPVISAVSPASGPPAGGTSITISGTGFTGATAVDFGTTPATSFTVESDSQITAVVPAGTGAAGVVVTTPAGASAAGATFTYEGAPAAGPTQSVYLPAAGTAPTGEWSASGFETVPAEGAAAEVVYYFAGDTAGATPPTEAGANVPGWSIYRGATQAVAGP